MVRVKINRGITVIIYVTDLLWPRCIWRTCFRSLEAFTRSATVPFIVVHWAQWWVSEFSGAVTWFCDSFDKKMLHFWISLCYHLSSIPLQILIFQFLFRDSLDPYHQLFRNTSLCLRSVFYILFLFNHLHPILVKASALDILNAWN